MLYSGVAPPLARTLLDSGQFIPGPEGVEKRPYLPKSFRKSECFAFFYVRRKIAILKICKIFLRLHSFSFLGFGQNGHFSAPSSARGAPEPAPLGIPGSFFLREPLSAFPSLETSCFKGRGGGRPCPPVRKRSILPVPLTLSLNVVDLRCFPIFGLVFAV